MAIENESLVVAYHQASGEKREIPEHWLGAKSPFPGQWAKSAPSKPKADEAPDTKGK